MRLTPTLTFLAFAALPSFAEVAVRFEEGAPKDRFVISADCTVSDIDITIDLSPSAVSLIFDVTENGAGVNVFQPVEVQNNAAQLVPVTDGDQVLVLSIPETPAGSEVIIFADLDDVLTNSQLGQIRVAGSEFDGATIDFVLGGVAQRATFENSTNLVSFAQGCIS